MYLGILVTSAKDEFNAFQSICHVIDENDEKYRPQDTALRDTTKHSIDEWFKTIYNHFLHTVWQKGFEPVKQSSFDSYPFDLFQE